MIVTILGMLLFTSGLGAHPFHVSLTEAEWNPKSKKLEVAIRLHPSDLEEALRQRTKKRISLEKTENIDELIQDYLASVFIVHEGKKKAAKIEWVGKEIDVKDAWLYVEIPLEQGPEGIEISNRAFFELLEDQVNLITIRDGKRRKSFAFTRDRASAKVSFPTTKP